MLHVDGWQRKSSYPTVELDLPWHSAMNIYKEQSGTLEEREQRTMGTEGVQSAISGWLIAGNSMQRM